MLAIRDLVVGRGRRGVARLEDAELGEGEVRLILGPSGCGKTTALFTLAGLLPPVRGEARLENVRIAPDTPARRSIGVVFQDVHLMSGLTVLQNVLLAPFAQGRRQETARAEALLDRLGLGGKAGAQADRLSRGEAQRTAVARALLLEPRLVLADEPTSSLDDRNALAVADLLQEAARTVGAGLIVATHDLRLASRFPARLALTALEAA